MPFVNQYKLVLGFPGVGKTFAAAALAEEGFKVVDLSLAHYPGEHEDDIGPYLAEIHHYLGDGYVVFASTAQAVRQAMNVANQPYLLVCPNRESKEEYLNRFTTREKEDSHVSREVYYTDMIDDLRSEMRTRNSRAVFCELKATQYLLQARKYLDLQPLLPERT